MPEFRRILLDGYPCEVRREGDTLVAGDGREVGVDEAIHLPPTEPTKIIAVHLNYASRTEEFMTKLPAAPTYFHKPITALNSHKAGVVRPAGCKWLNYEGEIVIVIGRTCRNISPAQAGDYIAGYSIGNDYGLHDFRDTDAGSMLRVKGSDTLAPVGPGMVTDWDFRNKGIRTLVNGVATSAVSRAPQSPVTNHQSPFFHHHRRPIGQHLGDAFHDLIGLIAHADHGIGAHGLGVFDHFLKGLSARGLGQSDIGLDPAAQHRLQPADHVADGVSRPHGDAPYQSQRPHHPIAGRVIGGYDQHGHFLSRRRKTKPWSSFSPAGWASDDSSIQSVSSKGGNITSPSGAASTSVR